MSKLDPHTLSDAKFADIVGKQVPVHVRSLINGLSSEGANAQQVMDFLNRICIGIFEELVPAKSYAAAAELFRDDIVKGLDHLARIKLAQSVTEGSA